MSQESNEPELLYLSLKDWGAMQDPPIGRHYAAELAADGRVPGAIRTSMGWIVPKGSVKQPPTEESRARGRKRYENYESQQYKSRTRALPDLDARASK